MENKLKPILVGSRALRFHFPFYRKRFDTDADMWFCDGEDIKRTSMYEDFVGIPKNIYLEIASKAIEFDDFLLPCAEHLLTIKMSHLSWDISWYKHYHDVMHMLKCGVSFDQNFYKTMKSHWKIKHGNKEFLSLNKNKSLFFNDYVNYVIDHDFLHEAVAGENQPIYKSVLKENNEVMIDRDKFKKMNFEDKINLFKEEIVTIAIERWLLQERTKGKVSDHTAYLFSLRKTITNLTKGWATDFIIFNLLHFSDYPKHYFSNARKKIEIKRFAMNSLSNEEAKTVMMRVYKVIWYCAYNEEPTERMCESVNLHDMVYFLGEYANFIKEERDGVSILKVSCNEYEQFEYNIEVIFSVDKNHYKVSNLIYRSYGGYSVDDFVITRVQPKEVIVTVYE